MSNLKLNDPYVNFLLPSTDGNDISLDMAESINLLFLVVITARTLRHGKIE